MIPWSGPSTPAGIEQQPVEIRHRSSPPSSSETNTFDCEADVG